MAFTRRVIRERDLAQPGVQSGLSEDDYSGKLLKYIPAETVAAYVTINGLLSAVTGVPTVFLWIVFAILTALTAGYAWKSTQVKGLPTAYVQLVIQTVGFVVWVASLGGPFTTLVGYESYYGPVVLILYTVFIPLVT